MLSIGTLQGAGLYWQQWRGLFLKRALSAKRDRLALVTQLLVPIALVLVALWARQATDAFPQEPALGISRYTFLLLPCSVGWHDCSDVPQSPCTLDAISMRTVSLAPSLFLAQLL